MVLIHRLSEMKLEDNSSPISDFSWRSSSPLGKLSKSKYLDFDIRSLFPGKFSFPYHFHRNAEELFMILEGEATLRSPGGYQTVSQGDVIFFEEGPSGTHQLYNHSDEQFVYLDIRTRANIDVCEYPDSGKVNILPARDIFEQGSRVSYYSGEENVKDKWPEERIKKD